MRNSARHSIRYSADRRPPARPVTGPTTPPDMAWPTPVGCSSTATNSCLWIDLCHPPSGFFYQMLPEGVPVMNRPTSRREVLWRFGGLGGIALTHLLGQGGLLA